MRKTMLSIVKWGGVKQPIYKEVTASDRKEGGRK